MTLVLAGSVNMLRLDELSEVLVDADRLRLGQEIRKNEEELFDLIRNHGPVEEEE